MGKKRKKKKISSEFLSRLKQLGPDKRLRVILMLKHKAKKTDRRLSPAERKAVLKEIRQSTGKAIVKIDRILKAFNGKRLASKVDALGSLPVEVTISGIYALAEVEEVNAVLEDQSIHIFPKLKK